MTTTRLTVPCSQQALPELTEMELSCLAMVAEGKGLETTARALDLPQARVDLVLKAALEKLDADNLLQAISRALLAGKIGKDDISVAE